MANDFDNRGQKFFEEAASFVETYPVDDKSTHRSRLRLHLLKALIVVLSGSSYLNGPSSPLAPEEVKKKLGAAISATLKKCTRHWKKQSEELDTGNYLYTLLAALGSSDVIEAEQLDSKAISTEELVQASKRGIEARRLYGWKLRGFLLRHRPDSIDKSLAPTKSKTSGELKGTKALDVLSDDQDLASLVLECTNVTLQSLKEEGGRLLYLKDLVGNLEFESSAEIQLTAIRCVVQTLASKFQIPSKTRKQLN